MSAHVVCRVATHLENLVNLEKSGNLRVVREKSENRKSQGKCVLTYGLLQRILLEFTEEHGCHSYHSMYECCSGK